MGEAPRSAAVLLDPSRAKVDGNGFSGPSWPISWAEHNRVCEHLLSGYADLARTARGDDAPVLRILAMEYLQEALRLWFVASLRQRFAARGLSPEGLASVEATAGWSSAADRSDRMRDRYANAPLRGLLRPALGLWRDDGFSWRWPQTLDMSKRLVVTSPGPLTTARAKAAEEPVYLVSMRYWFAGLGETPDPAGGLSVEALDACCALLSAAAGTVGDVLPGDALAHLHAWMAEAGLRCGHLLTHLRRRPKRLPRRLWTGSGGYFYHRILHTAVREAGGVSESHDHGSGLGIFDMVDPNMTEFVTPDRFVTFSAAMAEGYRRQQRPDMQLGARWPEVVPAGVTIRRVGTVAAPVGQGRRLLFLANQYRRDQIPFTPIEFDMVAIDWQARLFSHFAARGWDVHYRPHPDGDTGAAGPLSRLPGVTIDRLPFDQSVAAANVIVYDYLHSTALVDGLRSGASLIYVDFGHCPLWTDAQGLLERRMRVVRGHYDSDNRCQVDWASLDTALEEAPGLVGDATFLQSYWQGSAD